MTTPIVTFYSYKGGVGRSMALANVAWLLATRYGKKVLAVDWDLEAPGLHRFFGFDEERSKRGVIDILVDYKEYVRKTKPDLDQDFLKINECLFDVKMPRECPGSIKVLRAGASRPEYGSKVAEFDWKDFYQTWYGFGFIEYLKKQFRSIADIVLIDSRTGVTDSGGVCTLQFPDVVVILFALNEQNIHGTKLVADKIVEGSSEFRKGTPPKLILVPSRVEEHVEIDRLEEWQNKAASRLHDFLPNDYSPASDELVKVDKSGSKSSSQLLYVQRESIPYFGYYNFGEDLAVQQKPQIALSLALGKLTKRIVDTVALSETQAVAVAKRGAFLSWSIAAIVVVMCTFVAIKYLIHPGSEKTEFHDLLREATRLSDTRDETDLNLAIEEFNRALEFQFAARDSTSLMRIYGGLGQTYYNLSEIKNRQSNLELSVGAFRKALTFQSDSGNTNVAAEIQLKSARIHRIIGEQRNDETMLRQSINSLTILGQPLSGIANPAMYAQAKNEIGLAYHALFSLRRENRLLYQAIDSFRDAIAFSTTAGDSTLEGVSLNYIGESFRNLYSNSRSMGSFIDSSLSVHQAALKLFEQRRDSINAARSLTLYGYANMVAFWSQQKRLSAVELKRAIEAYENAWKLLSPAIEHAGLLAWIKKDLGVAYKELARVESPQDNLDKGIHLMNEALSYYQSEKSSIDVAYLQRNLDVALKRRMK